MSEDIKSIRLGQGIMACLFILTKEADGSILKRYITPIYQDAMKHLDYSDKIFIFNIKTYDDYN